MNVFMSVHVVKKKKKKKKKNPGSCVSWTKSGNRITVGFQNTELYQKTNVYLAFMSVQVAEQCKKKKRKNQYPGTWCFTDKIR